MAFGSSPLATATASGADGGTSSGIDTTGAALLVANVSWYADTSDTNNPTLSDSKGNTWTGLTTVYNTHCGGRLYYCINPVVGSGHTFTLTGTGVYAAVVVTAWTDSGTGTAYDKQNGASDAVISTQTPGSVTPAANGSLLVTGLLTSELGTVSIGSSFTIAATVGFAGGTNEGATQAYRVQATAAALNPQWAKTGTAGVLIATIAVFTPGTVTSAITAATTYYRMIGA